MGIIKSMLFMSIFLIFPAHSSWYKGEQKGWLWYKKTLLPMKKENKKDTTSKVLTYSGRMEVLRKNFEEIQAKAILEPTLDNVQVMQQAQNAIMNRATEFEKYWMLASLLTSQNFRSSDQPSPQHRKVYQVQFDRQLDQKIRSLAKTYGLFFIFKEDCPFCHEFAPIIKDLMNLYGFDVKAISADGKALELFPDAEADNGTIAVLNPEGIYPSLFLVNPQSRQVIPLARGLVSLSQLRENFKVIIRFLEEAPHG
ncbi:MAG: conjugal transfer protein TraF [Alphaproteobacteria bacterium]|jgi:conjugal transfer pilus assembly protein TraF|nr:conjugal transfer protein TraF [Alphaproteobacteria bacterium]